MQILWEKSKFNHPNTTNDPLAMVKISPHTLTCILLLKALNVGGDRVSEGECLPYCPKCGEKVTEDATFCSSCGTALRGATRAVRTRPSVQEDYEKQEKREKGEKREKREKGGPAWRGPLIAGLVLIILGAILYLQTRGILISDEVWPVFLIVIGIILIVFVATGMSRARTRNPRT